MGAMAEVERMRDAVEALLDALDEPRRSVATADFDTPDHREWTYLPGPRPGLRLGDVTAAQHELALNLLDTGCSTLGAATARGIIELERILDDLIGYDSGGDPYWFRILGDPAGDDPWGWRINGHHLAVHLTVVGDDIRVTPSFFGAQPAVVPHGPHQGLRTLPGEEDLARELLTGLDARQRDIAVVDDAAPADILTRRDPVAEPSALPTGLAAAELSESQREQVRRLARCYFDRAPLRQAEANWQAVIDAGLDAVTFAWAGSDQPGKGHYYCLRGPTFLIEYDNTQNGANHIHSVWRNFAGDWGEDLLAAHYAHSHHH